jgi:uncharacterized membrane protein
MKIGRYDFHLHLISVHFTNGLFPVAIFFLILFIFSPKESFRITYFYLMILATLSAPISFLTGVIEWKQKYRGAKVKIFIRKYRYGLILMLIGTICTCWYGIFPEVLENKGLLWIIFLLLNLSILPTVTYLGYLGGKLILGGSH